MWVHVTYEHIDKCVMQRWKFGIRHTMGVVMPSSNDEGSVKMAFIVLRLVSMDRAALEQFYFCYISKTKSL
jgi:hypothetical protein